MRAAVVEKVERGGARYQTNGCCCSYAFQRVLVGGVCPRKERRGWEMDC